MLLISPICSCFFKESAKTINERIMEKLCLLFIFSHISFQRVLTGFDEISYWDFKVTIQLQFLVYIGPIKPLKKVKVKLSLCSTKHHAMKTYWGSGGE
jgi:hypothetical protein